MVRVNRVVRNEIASLGGEHIVEEIERWNDAKLDSLEEHGVEISDEEDVRQQAMYRSLVERESDR